MNADPNGPESVVQRQPDASNAKDLKVLLAVYADDAEWFDPPETLLARGSAALRLRFGARFRVPNLQATLVGRVDPGQFVVDHERVRRTFPQGPGEIQLAIGQSDGVRIVPDRPAGRKKRLPMIPGHCGLWSGQFKKS